MTGITHGKGCADDAAHQLLSDYCHLSVDASAVRWDDVTADRETVIDDQNDWYEDRDCVRQCDDNVGVGDEVKKDKHFNSLCQELRSRS